MQTDMNNLIAKISETLPPVFTRKVAAQSLGGLVGPRTLANIDHGAVKFKVGKKVLYEKEAFIKWLAEHYNLV